MLLGRLHLAARKPAQMGLSTPVASHVATRLTPRRPDRRADRSAHCFGHRFAAQLTSQPAVHLPPRTMSQPAAHLPARSRAPQEAVTRWRASGDVVILQSVDVLLRESVQLWGAGGKRPY